MFVGQEDHKVPNISRVLEEGDLFRVVGRIIGHCFLNGGPPFHGLSPVVVQMILGTVFYTTLYMGIMMAGVASFAYNICLLLLCL